VLLNRTGKLADHRRRKEQDHVVVDADDNVVGLKLRQHAPAVASAAELRRALLEYDRKWARGSRLVAVAVEHEDDAIGWTGLLGELGEHAVAGLATRWNRRNKGEDAA
jgi:hypothetical protein